VQKCLFSLIKQLFFFNIAAFYGTFDGRQPIYDEIVEIPLAAVRDQEIIVDILLKR